MPIPYHLSQIFREKFSIFSYMQVNLFLNVQKDSNIKVSCALLVQLSTSYAQVINIKKNEKMS